MGAGSTGAGPTRPARRAAGRTGAGPTGAAEATVLVVDDHPLVAVSLANAVRAPDLDAAHLGVADLAELDVRMIVAGRGLVVLDLDLGEHDGRELDGADLVPPIRAAGWNALLLTGSRDRARIAAGVAAGALGWLSKNLPFEEIVAAVSAAARGLPVFDAVERDELVAEHYAAVRSRADLERRWSRLTPRETEVLARLVAGRRVAEVARESVVSEATVRTQVRSILAKLEVRSQLEAVAVAKEVGLSR